jgi:hypothetical protein
MAEDFRAMLEANLRQPMREAEAARKRRFRDKRRQAGWQDQLIWLSPEGQAALADLRQPGETLDVCINRVLIAATHRQASRTSPATSPVSSPESPPTSPAHDPAHHGTSPVPRPARPVPRPDQASTPDAALLALLRQETPRLTYAQIAAQLGLSLSQVKHKATAWTQQGVLRPRPRGGARPRPPTAEN